MAESTNDTSRTVTLRQLTNTKVCGPRIRSSPRRIEDLVAVDDAGTGDLDILRAVGEDQGPVPFAPPGLGQEGGRRRMLIQVGVLGADQHGPGLQIERDVALEVYRGRQIPPRREAHLAAAGLGAGRHGLVERRRIERLAVAGGSIVTNIEYPGFGGARRPRRPEQHQRHDQPYGRRQPPAPIRSPLHVRHHVISYGTPVPRQGTSPRSGPSL